MYSSRCRVVLLVIVCGAACRRAPAPAGAPAAAQPATSAAAAPAGAAGSGAAPAPPADREQPAAPGSAAPAKPPEGEVVAGVGSETPQQLVEQVIGSLAERKDQVASAFRYPARIHWSHAGDDCGIDTAVRSATELRKWLQCLFQVPGLETLLAEMDVADVSRRKRFPTGLGRFREEFARLPGAVLIQALRSREGEMTSTELLLAAVRADGRWQIVALAGAVEMNGE